MFILINKVAFILTNKGKYQTRSKLSVISKIYLMLVDNKSLEHTQLFSRLRQCVPEVTCSLQSVVEKQMQKNVDKSVQYRAAIIYKINYTDYP